ncbi:uncharacterized protein LOC119601716 [Lucilia sericata]|uniref:uncharacterized protein LOC119601716 n=1 Tax=Lucilia sericata TaxID=13632 RepID=UPI0018A7F5AF|nr:uncharacterized protein LOC119601716 [Lucilia sericata]
MNKPPNITNQTMFDLDNNKHMNDLSLGPKYLVMTRVQSDDTLTNVSPFLIKKVIDCVCGEVETCKKLQAGTILIKTKNSVQANKLIKLISLSPTIKIEISEHKTLNTTKGVIYCNDLRNIEENEILQELKNQNVIEVKKILKKVDDKLVETGLLIITFSSINLPETINIGYQITRVRPYIPLPLKCHNCFRFGHISKFCKNDKLCVNCGNIDHLAENEVCENPKLCNNCVENKLTDTKHSVVSKTCPIFLKYKEIQAIKTLEKVDNKTAMQKYNERHINKSTFATVTRQHVDYSNIDNTIITPSTSNSIKTSPTPIQNIQPKTFTANVKQTTSSIDTIQTKTMSPPKKNQTIKILPKTTSRRTRSQLKNEAKRVKTSQGSQDSDGTDQNTAEE